MHMYAAHSFCPNAILKNISILMHSNVKHSKLLQTRIKPKPKQTKNKTKLNNKYNVIQYMYPNVYKYL